MRRPYILGFALMMVLSACGDRSHPNFTYMPDMAYSPAVKAQEVGGMRRPVEGTVPRGFEPYPYDNQPELAGRRLHNPLRRTRANILHGKELYEATCIVCHGADGQGRGTVVPKFPQPPTLHSDKVRDWTDGRIFHVITEGQNMMGSYATQFDPEERWAIIHYVRVLQRAQNPTPQDLKRLENW